MRTADEIVAELLEIVRRLDAIEREVGNMQLFLRGRGLGFTDFEAARDRARAAG